MPKNLRDSYEETAKYWIDICQDSVGHMILMAEDAKNRDERETGEVRDA